MGAGDSGGSTEAFTSELAPGDDGLSVSSSTLVAGGSTTPVVSSFAVFLTSSSVPPPLEFILDGPALREDAMTLRGDVMVTVFSPQRPASDIPFPSRKVAITREK